MDHQRGEPDVNIHQRLMASYKSAALVLSHQWSSTDKTAGMTLSESGMLASRPASGSGEGVRGSLSIPSSGKYYFEIEIVSGVDNGINAATPGIGLATAASNLTESFLGLWQWGVSSQGRLSDGSRPFGTSSTDVGDIYGFAINTSLGHLFISRNGVWGGSCDPVTGANPLLTGVTGTLYPLYKFATNIAASARLRTSSNGLNSAPPAGFTAL